MSEGIYVSEKFQASIPLGHTLVAYHDMSKK